MATAPLSLPDLPHFFYINRKTILKSLYSDDGNQRKNIYELEEPLKAKAIELSKSIGCLIEAKFFEKDGPTDYLLKNQTLKDRCEEYAGSVQFIGEISAGLGTAFVVGKSPEGKYLALTARHCVCEKTAEGQISVKTTLVEKTRLVFGFQRFTETADYKTLLKENIFNIHVAKFVSSPEEDWALLDLSSTSPETKSAELVPLPCDFINLVPLTLKISMLGYPLGLPIKYASGKTVLPKNLEEKPAPPAAASPSKIAHAKIASFKGNSGSPIFNETTGKVIGILIAGNKDFTKNSAGEKIEMVYEGEQEKYERFQVLGACSKELIDAIKPGESQQIEKIDAQWNHAVQAVQKDPQQAIPLLEPLRSQGMQLAYLMLAQLDPDKAKEYLHSVTSYVNTSGSVIGPDAFYSIVAQDGIIDSHEDHVGKYAIKDLNAHDEGVILAPRGKLAFAAQHEGEAGKNGVVIAPDMVLGEGAVAITSANPRDLKELGGVLPDKGKVKQGALAELRKKRAGQPP